MSWRLGSVAVAFALVAAGCGRLTEPTRTTVLPQANATKARNAAPRLSTSVEGEHSAVTGTNLQLTLTVTNHERTPVSLSFQAACHLLFVVYDESGTQVGPAWFCADIPTTLNLGPKETVRETTWWPLQHYDVDQHQYVPLPPALYTVQAYVSGHGYFSPPFKVRVVAPALAATGG